MEDDDDAFLYGDEPAPAPAASKPEDAVNGTTAAAAAAAASAPTTTSDAKDAAAGTNKADEQDEGDDDDDDEDDEDGDEDSDSDIEFIIDATQEAQQPPPRPGFQRPGAPGARPLPNQSTPQRPQSTLTSEYTPLSRSQLLANASPASTTAGATSAAQPAGVSSSALPPPPGAPPVKPQTALDGVGPEGGPPAVPSTAPRLDLSPGPDDRAYPKPQDAVEEEESSAQDIYDVDLDNLADKPWRRYGADLTDYFNYGFNEESWSVWRGKKERMTEARKQTEASLFGGNNGDMMPNMQQMMAMMPPPQAMQQMMGQNGGPGAGPMGMPMPPDQMMAMMASMSGMPGMPPMPGMPNMPPMGGRGMNPMMMPGMFGGGPPSNGGPGPGPSGNEQQNAQHQRYSNSPFPQAQQDGRNSPYPPSQTFDKPNDQDADQDPTRGWDTPASPRRDIKEEKRDDLAPAPAAPPGMPPMKAMSDADMSAFFGAAGVDLSQAAAAGFQVPKNGATDSGDAGKKPPSAPAKPNPPKSAPSGPAATKGTSIRGRAAAAAASTSTRSGRAVSPTLPPNVPSGPKNPGKRYNDRDTGAGAADLLDYGATAGGDEYDERDSRERSHGVSGWDSPERSRRGGRSRREGTYDHHDSASANGHDDHMSRRGGASTRTSRRAADEWDDDGASQTSASGRRKRGGASSRDQYRDREPHRSERDRDREREKDRDREREREREREARSQARSERRAGRDLDDPAIPTGPAADAGKRGSRKRSAPEDRDAEEEHDGPPAKSNSSGRKGGARKKR